MVTSIKNIFYIILLYCRKIIASILIKFGFIVIKAKHNKSIIEAQKNAILINFLIKMQNYNLNNKVVLKNIKNTQSQTLQDLFILSIYGNKKGFFLEAGACDGMYLSNTYLLEKKYNWQGLLIEPNSYYYDNLKINRNAKIILGALGYENGKATFVENKSPELSYLKKYEVIDKWNSYKNPITEKKISVYNFNSLLKQLSFRPTIDYISLDLEGAEYPFLQSIDFKNVEIGVVTVEHNYGEDRTKIYDLMIKNNFNRVFESVSDQDDWYVNKSIYDKFFQ